MPEVLFLSFGFHTWVRKRITEDALKENPGDPRSLDFVMLLALQKYSKIW